MEPFLVLADCRCGGTALVSALGSHPDIQTQGELLDPTLPGYVAPDDWGRFLSLAFATCDGWHLQRYQIPTVDQWELVARWPNLRVIDLRRENLTEQYASWCLASELDLWHERPAELPRIAWDQAEHDRITADWTAGRQLTDEVLERWRVPVLRVTFEQLAADFDAVAERCQEFLGVSVRSLTPATRRMPSVDYSSIYEGWPG